MSLSKKQQRFTRCIAKLIIFANEKGFELTFGDAYRSPTNPDGHPKSCHRSRLAVDFNLFVNGIYATQDSAHQEMGEYWESLDPDARWGGRFRDGNHYSFEHDGVK